LADEVLDLKAAADFLKVSKPTFYRWLAQGKLKGFKAGQQWRFYRRDLEKFLESEEPVAIPTGAAEVEQAVYEARKAQGLAPIEWDRPGELLDPSLPAEENPIQRVVNTIIATAIDERASDIHVDVGPEEVRVRYRIDGVLHERMNIPKYVHAPLVSRLKLEGDMDIAERRVPQNGRIRMRHRERDYDVRVQTVPSVFGEAVVMRILDQSSVLIGLNKLGMSEPVQAAFERRLRAPQGLIVSAGPSGCGKTTTLYSALNLVNRPEVQVVTIEDPVEYHLRGVTQVHVNRKAGVTFAVGARTFMRFDPDIIMVGAIRDLDTAEICMQAAMTGNIVLTAMMPGHAEGVITRLAEMGVEPFLIAASVSAVLAQRLVRKVCPSCKAEYQPSRETLRRLGMSEDQIAGAKFYRGGGCDQCHHTGYYGRTGVFELLEVDDRLREVIARGAATAELRAAAVDAGMITMLRDGLEKAQQGLTTIEELLRVLAVGGVAGP
jgi:excisionase family DNA binding protein